MIKNEIGNIYGRLTVNEFSHKDKHGLCYWKVTCSCGNVFAVSGNSLRTGNTRSCGCLQRESVSKPLDENVNWKGGISIIDGYAAILMPFHPMANGRGYINNNRLVMESMLMRYLTRKEVVHHIDHDRLNDSEDNLILFQSHSEHMKYHWQNKK